jgi:hypothetical protein
MDDLNRALGDIRDIRRQVAHSTEFRGYGPMTLAATAVMAVAAACAQSMWARGPAGNTFKYVVVWGATAVLSAALILTQTLTRAQRMHSGMADEMIRMAVEQFLPAAVAGTLVTVVLLRANPGAAWVLPALWQIIYSLGVFSSCRFLPRAMLAAGGWYLLTGLITLALGARGAMSPWTMGIAFGVGQSLIGAIMYVAGKRPAHDS